MIKWAFFTKKTQGNQSLQDDVPQSERGTFTNPYGGRCLFICWNVWNSTLVTRNWARLSILRNPSWTGSANNGDPVIKHRNWSSEISTGYTCWLVVDHLEKWWSSSKGLFPIYGKKFQTTIQHAIIYSKPPSLWVDYLRDLEGIPLLLCKFRKCLRWLTRANLKHDKHGLEKGVRLVILPGSMTTDYLISDRNRVCSRTRFIGGSYWDDPWIQKNMIGKLASGLRPRAVLPVCSTWSLYLSIIYDIYVYIYML